MGEQLINGILTTLASAITSPSQTTGIQIVSIPGAVTGTMRFGFGGNGGEIGSFTGTTGTGPFTLTGVTRGVEGTTPGTYSAGALVGVGILTAGALAATSSLSGATATIRHSDGSQTPFYAASASQTDVGIAIQAAYNAASKGECAAWNIPFTGTGTGNFTMTIEGTTTGNIAFSTVRNTLSSHIQTALNTTFGTGAFFVTGSGGTGIDSLQLLVFGGTYANRPVALPTFTRVTGTYSSGPATVLTTGNAATGDTIHVNQSGTVTQSLAAHGLNWNFGPGVTITMSMTDPNFIFSDAGPNYYPVPMSYEVFGSGKFVRSLSGPAVGAGGEDIGVIQQLSSGSKTSFYFDTMNIAFAAGQINLPSTYEAMIALDGGGPINLVGGGLYTSNATAGGVQVAAIWWGSGPLNVQVTEIAALIPNQTDSLIWIYNDQAVVGDLRVNCERLDAGGTQYVAITGQNAAGLTSPWWINALTVQGMVVMNSGKLYLDCQKLIGSCVITNESADVQLYLRADKIGGDLPAGGNTYVSAGGSNWFQSGYTMTAANPYITVISGVGGSQSFAPVTVYATVNQFEPGANVSQLINVSGGAVAFVNGQDITAAASQDAITVSGTGSTVNLLGGKITTGAGHYDLTSSGSAIINVSPGVIYDPTKVSTSTSGVINATFRQPQAPTTSAPPYLKGSTYFDTTLNKLRVGGASGWETLTSS